MSAATSLLDLLDRADTAERVSKLLDFDQTLAYLAKAVEAGVDTHHSKEENVTLERATRRFRRLMHQASSEVQDAMLSNFKWEVIDEILGGEGSQLLYQAIRHPTDVKGAAAIALSEAVGEVIGGVPAEVLVGLWQEGFFHSYHDGAQWGLSKLTNAQAIKFELRDPNILKAINDRITFRATHFGNELGDAISKWMVDGAFEQGLGPLEMKRQFRKQFPGIAGWRFDRIARTESLIGVSSGTFDSFKHNGVAFIEWQAHVDDRVRPSHAHVDGEQIKLGDKFTNGLRYPGDPDGDLREIINCRCVMAPVNPDLVAPDRLWTGGAMPKQYVAPSGGMADDLYEYTLGHGGATFNPRSGKHFKGQGYAVAEQEGTFATVKETDREAFRKAVEELRAKYPDAYVGTWHHDGVIEIDPSRVYRNRAAAVNEAVSRNQKAIFDLKRGEDINLTRSPSRVDVKEVEASNEKLAADYARPHYMTEDQVEDWVGPGGDATLADPERVRTKRAITENVGDRLLKQNTASGEAQRAYDAYAASRKSKVTVEDFLESTAGKGVNTQGLTRKRGESDDDFLARIAEADTRANFARTAPDEFNTEDSLAASFEKDWRTRSLANTGFKDRTELVEQTTGIKRKAGESEDDFLSRASHEVARNSITDEIERRAEGATNALEATFSAYRNNNQALPYDQWQETVYKPQLEDQVNGVLHQWAVSSGDDHYQSQFTQYAAEHQFGISGSDPTVAAKRQTSEDQVKVEVGSDVYYSLSDADKAAYGTPGNPKPGTFEKLGEEALAQRQRDLQAMYDDTQAYFKEQGIDEVTLYRGMALDAEDVPFLSKSFNGDDMTVETPTSLRESVVFHGAPLSSWTYDPEVALRFAAKGFTGDGQVGVVARMVVPTDRILSTARTGLGSLPEKEVVVLDSPGQMDMQIVSYADPQLGPTPITKPSTDPDNPEETGTPVSHQEVINLLTHGKVPEDMSEEGNSFIEKFVASQDEVEGQEELGLDVEQDFDNPKFAEAFVAWVKEQYPDMPDNVWNLNAEQYAETVAEWLAIES